MGKKYKKKAKKSPRLKYLKKGQKPGRNTVKVTTRTVYSEDIMHKAITNFNLQAQALPVNNKKNQKKLNKILREISQKFCDIPKNYENFRKALKRRLPCFKQTTNGVTQFKRGRPASLTEQRSINISLNFFNET